MLECMPTMPSQWLLSVLNPKTLANLQKRLEAAEQADGPFYSTAECLEMITYH